MDDEWTPTSVERELLATSDADILKRHQSFSFDVDELTRRVENGDRWQQLIQGQLYFEHVVARILYEALAKPEAIALSRMGFSQRLDLVVAMALLPDDLLAPVRRLSALRNKIAHDLTFEVSDSDIRDLENCTPVQLRDAVQSGPDRSPGPLKLHEIITVVLLKVDIVRQHHAASREISMKSELRLRTVLRRISDVIYVP